MQDPGERKNKTGAKHRMCVWLISWQAFMNLQMGGAGCLDEECFVFVLFCFGFCILMWGEGARNFLLNPWHASMIELVDSPEG